MARNTKVVADKITFEEYLGCSNNRHIACDCDNSAMFAFLQPSNYSAENNELRLKRILFKIQLPGVVHMAWLL